jgi:AcrR family transcriptional regulator
MATNPLVRPLALPPHHAATAVAANTEAAARDPQRAIFDAAERLCAEYGLEVVSVRDIARAAGVNLSAINYYFGSRTNLIVSILRTRLHELESERETLIEALQHQERPDLREILRAVLLPLSRWRRPGSNRRHALMYLSRSLSAAEPELRQETAVCAKNFRAVIDLLQRALPDYSREEICWRFHFLMGIEHLNTYDADRLQVLSDGACRSEDQEETLERAVDFALAGFLAPPRAPAAGRG